MITATVTIFDEMGNPISVRTIAPSRTFEERISTRYVFAFEYNRLNYDKFQAELERSEKYEKS